jgi:chemotaxis family two-component system sensor kinase Cph1
VCTFIVQNAMSKYETLVKQGRLDINQQIYAFQDHLLQRLAYHKTINCALVESLNNLRLMMQSDGVAIFNEGDVYFDGIDLSTNDFFDIIKYIQQLNKPTVFIDHNFRKNHQKNFKQKLPFAGLLAYNVDKNKGYYIVWFRNETIMHETQMRICADSPYGIQVWQEDIYDSALPWNDEELSLLDGLQQTLNTSLIQNLLENKNMAKNLSQLNNELEMFTYTLSHDLKNPLSILKMGLQYLENTKEQLDEVKRKKWFTTLSSGIQNIEDIINNILHLSHDKYNKITKDSIPLKFLLRKIVEETRLVYEGNTCEVVYGTLLPIWGEKSAVYQVFTNVISNAMKYSQQKPEPKIYIGSKIENNAVCYEIRDNGIGIPESDMDRIYNMFGRGKNTTYYKGSGIGLSLVKRIMDRLEAHIEITSTEGEGTTVRMRFPIVGEFPNVMLERTSAEEHG